MTEWLTIAEARAASGLRLVLAKGSWGLWSECAKNIMHVDEVPYLRAPQIPFGENSELLAWTGARNNPVAVFDDEPARTSWLDILNLAERLSPSPRLLPKDSAERALVIGISNEICGENGFGWCRRIELGAKSDPAQGLQAQVMTKDYRGKAGDVSAEEARIAAILAGLADRLKAQKAAGSRYLVGRSITAADVYWATCSNLVGALALDVNSMSPALRAKFADAPPVIQAALDPILFEHRDFIYEAHLPLPIDFG